MTTHDFPALGFNPAPGNLGSVDDLTGKLDSAKRSLDSAHAVLSRLGKGGGDWEGDAAKAFAGKVGDLPKYVSDSRDAMHDAVTQLRSWHTALSSYQTKGRQHEADAAAAEPTVAPGRRRTSARTTLTTRPPPTRTCAWPAPTTPTRLPWTPRRRRSTQRTTAEQGGHGP